MDLLKKLNQVAHETSCSLFSLCVNPDGKWKMYIYQSKIVIIGDFEQVATATIKELESNRELLSDSPKKHRFHLNRKYRYTGFPKIEITAESKKQESVYSQKLKYSKSLGYSNVADCLSKMGMTTFNNGFKVYRENK